MGNNLMSSIAVESVAILKDINPFEMLFLGMVQ